MGRFETQWLTAEKSLSALIDLSGQWLGILFVIRREWLTVPEEIDHRHRHLSGQNGHRIGARHTSSGKSRHCPPERANAITRIEALARELGLEG